MHSIENKTARSMDFEEMQAILDACKILSNGFKKRVYKVGVNPTTNNQEEIHSIFIAFDMVRIDSYGKPGRKEQ